MVAYNKHVWVGGHAPHGGGGVGLLRFGLSAVCLENVSLDDLSNLSRGSLSPPPALYSRAMLSICCIYHVMKLNEKQNNVGLIIM